MPRKTIFFLVLSVAAMLVLGIVMLFSTGAFAQDAHGDPVYFVKRQGMWLAISFCACIVAALIDYHWWQRCWWLFLGLAIVLLALCFIPPVGMRINGSWRWVNFKVFTFQPSEFAKFAVILFLAFWYSKYAHEARKVMKGFVLPSLIVLPALVLILTEEDLGTTMLLGITIFIFMFVAGVRLWLLGPIALLGLCGVFYIALMMPERLGRLMAFMDLEKYKDGAALQQLQALIAFGSGGIDGLGLGSGRQKMLYIPFAHTDFIFPMIGEELGLRFTLLVVFCYLIVILCGTMIALNARDRFGMLLGFGFVVLLALQAAINIGVTTALLPNKGFPLPFISYGGSNLLFCLFGIGVLINIYRQGYSGRVDSTDVRLRAKITPRI